MLSNKFLFPLSRVRKLLNQFLKHNPIFTACQYQVISKHNLMLILLTFLSH